MRALLLFIAFFGISISAFAQNGQLQQLPDSDVIINKGRQKTIGAEASNPKPLVSVGKVWNKQIPDGELPLSPNGKLLSVDGYEVDFLVPSDTAISNVCYTPRPVITDANAMPKSASCPFTVPCDDPANRDGSNFTNVKYFQLEWHIMQSTSGGASSNIDQVRVDELMAELNADYASHNMIFCANPATFYVDDVNYTHDSNTEEVSLKTAYVVNPTEVINIYVVGTMSAGGYARFPYDPMGGTSNTGGIVLARGNCNVGTHTLAHEMGHTFGLEHTFAGVDERTTCSACYEQVRNVNGSSNVSGAATPLGGPYLQEGDQEGDWCSDTNPHDTYSYNCSTSSNTNGACDSNPWNNAPVNNHMSYSFCSSQFSDQQGRRMHCMVDTYLGSWMSYAGGICGALPPVADFVGTPITWQAPSNVTFTDLSAPTAIITNWTWVFDVGASGTVTCAGCTGANAQFIGQTPPVVTYPNVGLYTVSLTVDSPNGNDTETKIDYIEVVAPAGDCDTLDLYWENPVPAPTVYGGLAVGEHLLMVPDLSNSPTGGTKGAYEQYITPNPGVTQVGAIRVGLSDLDDIDDDMVFQVVVYDDDGGGLPGALLGGSGGISPTAIGVPLSGTPTFQEFWIPFAAVTPTTATFHIGIEVFPGDLTDELVLVASSSATGQGLGNGLNHIWSEDFGYENLLGTYGLDVDLDLIPMLGEYAPLPLITGYTEDVVCDTTFVTLFDTALYSSVSSWVFEFSDGTSFNSTTDPGFIDRIYNAAGPETVMIAAINDCGRGDTTFWTIPYGFLTTPDAEFTATPANPVCMGTPVDFTANTSGYMNYNWDVGDGTAPFSTAGVETTSHTYTTPGLYYVELTVDQAGYLPADTFYLEQFETGWPAGYLRYNYDGNAPFFDPPFDNTNATAWLNMDADNDGDGEAASTSWYTSVQTSDDWMITTGIGILPANQRLFWDGEALDAAFPDGYEVRISTAQLPATVANYNTVLFATAAENSFPTTRSVDLGAYAGQTVYIAFINNSTDQFLLTIDNIRVGTATAGCSNATLYTDFVEVVDCSMLPPVTVLNTDVSSGCAPLTVTFTDATTVGDPADSWLWNFGDGTFSTDQNPLPHLYPNAGSYFVIFESCNNGGCSQDTITIFVGDPATIDNVATVDPTCAGNDGSITITASGGTGTLQYSIDNGVTFQASNVFNGLGGATYDIVVEDAIGCQVTTTVTLTAPPTPTITGVTQVDVLCNGDMTGQIVVTATGGTGTLNYSSDLPHLAQSSNILNSFPAGTYMVTVEDANGCTDTFGPVIITEPATPVAVVNIVSNDPSCNGVADGDINITASGGTGALQYSIDNGVTFQASNSFTGLGGATYNVVVEDANGCQVSTTVTLTDPPAVSITNINAVDPTCAGNDGSIEITATGGTGALQYSIDNGVTFQAGITFTGLSGASYDIIVEDANGCQATTTVVLTALSAPTIDNVVVTDPLCNGGTGTIVITASGGSGALQYSIDNGVTFQASGTFAGLAAATYNLVVEDATGCQAFSTATITIPTAVLITNVASTDPLCNGATNGDITITASGGTGALQYSIDNGVTFQAGNIFNGLSAATYDIVVEDVNGCQTTTTVTLSDPPSVLITNVAVVDPSCVGNDGTIDITASGGTGALQYSIDNGITFQAGNLFTGLSGATYNIIVEDANGCQVTSTATLTVTSSPTIDNVTATDPSCPGATDGSIVITASGGTGTIEYSIDNGVTFQASNTFNGIGANVYNVVIQDANFCQATTMVTLTDPPSISINAVNTVDPSCGANDGSIDINATGGTGALQYSIDNGVTFQAGNLFTGLGAATYDVVVEDGNGCQVTTTATLNSAGGPTIDNVASTDPLCNGGSDGDITITASGGTGAIQYSIDNGVTFQAGNNFAGIGAAVYNIVIEDGVGCQASTTVTLNDPAPVMLVNVATTDPTCNGGADGSLTITASGGTGALQYSIDNGVTFQASTNFTGLSAITYNIVVEDVNGCQTSTSVTLNDPAAVTYTIVITDENCGLADGQIDLTAAGGIGSGYQFSIDNGVTFQASGTFTGLVAGPYNIIIQDGLGCQIAAIETVNGTGGPSITGINEDVSLLCFGDCNGELTATVTGGTLPYDYSWVDGGGAPVGGNSATVIGLCADTYTLTVVDNGGTGCPVLLTYTLNEPTQIAYTVSVIDENCGLGNGQIDITGVTGGTGAGYQYSIDNGVTFQPTGTFTGLTANTYNVVVMDGNNCQIGTVEVVNNIPGATIDNIASTDPTCGTGNGTITITASGGTGALQYSIDNGVTFQAGNNFTGLGPATYDIVVEDASGCQTTTSVTLVDPGPPTIDNLVSNDPTCGNSNGDITITASGGTGTLQYSIDNGVTFQAGINFTGLAGSTYAIVVEDAIGCQATASVTLINSNPPVISTVSSTDPACGNPDGQIDIVATGGTGTLQYSIDNGVTFQAGTNFSGLAAATYDVVVEDANGCQATTTVTLNNTAAPSIDNVVSTDPTCGNNNGDITITASGGTGSLLYSVNNGITFQGANSFTGLGAAIFDIVVEDALGCQSTTTVTLTDPGPPSVDNVVLTDPSCGVTDGSIVIAASGGTGALQYSIDNGLTFQGANNFTGLGPATYTIVVEDVNGCQAFSNATLVDPGTPAISSVSPSDPICGNDNGTILITVNGGAGAYQYSIDGGTTFSGSGFFSGLAAGTYPIVVQDANGCSVNSTITLTQAGMPSVSIDNIIDILCYGDGNGVVNISVTGGTAPYTFDWSTDGSGDFDDPEDLASGIPGAVSVTVQDANGCAVLETAIINGPAALWGTATSTPEAFGNDGEVNLNVGGGVPPYTFDWDYDGTGDNDDPEDPTGLAGNANYTVIITDANGCTDTVTIYVGSVMAIGELDNPMGVTISPNPNTGEFYISFDNYEGDVAIDIVDVAGKLIYQDQRNVAVNGSIGVYLLYVESGVYFVNVHADGNTYSARVVKR